eukprot:8570407-Karenia_brevis.AAC.1
MTAALRPRPFLGPLFAWTASVPNGSCPALPIMLRLILTLLEEVFSQEYLVMDCRKSLQPKVRGVFKTDAMAENGIVAVGGGLVPPGGDTRDARWFFFEVSETSFPIVFQKGKDQAFRFITTLVLLGTLLGMQVFVWSNNLKDGAAEAGICALTDNLGNKFALQECLTTKYPMCCVLVDRAHRMATLGGEVDLQLISSNNDQHANDFGKKKFENLDPQHR